MSEAAGFLPPGPISAAFLENRDPISVLWGPIGSGKTTTALMRGVAVSYLKPPERDGVRRVKGAVIRRTYRDLWSATIPAWWAWVPPARGAWTGGRDEPATHELALQHPDGGRVELIVEWKAFGEQRLEEALRGWEGDWAYVDECDLLDERALPWLFTRLRRYRLQHATVDPDTLPAHVWGTCNATDSDHWLYRAFVLEPRPGLVLYRLPSGLAPRAERPPGITEEWYRVREATMQPWEARRLVHAEVGYSREGEPVFPEFSEDSQVARAPLAILPHRELVIGLDAGGSPAATCWQRATSGQVRGLAELAAPAGQVMGANRFGEALAQLLAERFRSVDPRLVLGVADPSAAYGADRVAGEDDWLQAVGAKARIRIIPAPTNALLPRLEAMRVVLRPIDARTPGLVLDPSMRRTRRAFLADYRYRRAATGQGQWRREDVPDKHSPNGASHLMDSAQYAVLHLGGYLQATARGEARWRQQAGPIRAPVRIAV